MVIIYCVLDTFKGIKMKNIRVLFYKFIAIQLNMLSAIKTGILIVSAKSFNIENGVTPFNKEGAIKTKVG